MMNNRYLNKMFRFVNQELFDGLLDVEIVQTIDNNTFFDYDIDGVCIPDFDGENWRYFIGIDETLNKTDAFNTLVHEMIHIYCMVNRNYSGHNGLFRTMTIKAVDVFYWEIL